MSERLSIPILGQFSSYRKRIQDTCESDPQRVHQQLLARGIWVSVFSCIKSFSSCIVCSHTSNLHICPPNCSKYRVILIIDLHVLFFIFYIICSQFKFDLHISHASTLEMFTVNRDVVVVWHLNGNIIRFSGLQPT